MSVLDQALIRAYGKDQARLGSLRAGQAVGASLTEATATEQSSGASSALSKLPQPHDDGTNLYCADQPAKGKAAPQARSKMKAEERTQDASPLMPTTRWDAACPTSVPAPHFAASESLPRQKAQPAQAVIAKIDDPARPLASPNPPADDAPATCNSALDVTTTLNPVWEVDSVEWPALCQHFIETQLQALDSVARKLVAAAKRGCRIQAISSCRRGEGRTTLALCLAHRIAASGARLLLVDGDFQNPQISGRLNLMVPRSWADAIREEVPLVETAVALLNEQFSILPLIATSGDGPSGLSPSRASALLRAAADSVDVILIDCAPWDDVELDWSEGERFSTMDGILLVRDILRTSGNEIDQLESKLHRGGILTIGIAENFTSASLG